MELHFCNTHAWYIYIKKTKPELYSLCTSRSAEFQAEPTSPLSPQEPSVLAQTADQPASLQLSMAHSLRPGHSTYCNVSIGTEDGIDRKGNLETHNGLEWGSVCVQICIFRGNFKPQ